MSEASIVLSATDNTKGAFDSVKGSLQGLHTNATAVAGSIDALTFKIGSLESNMSKAQVAALSFGKSLILGAAVGLGLDAIKDKILGVIDSMANLKTLSEKTGASVENLSKIGFIAKQSGSDIDSVATAMTKLSKGMAGADNETKGAGLALDFLGLKAKDAAGDLKDPSAMMTEIAKKLNTYQDGAGKAAIAQAMFGKAGAEMLPTLKLLGEQGEMVARVTDEQATAARQYTRDMVKLEVQKGLLFKTVAVALLPTMKDFVEVLLDASKETNILNGAAKGLANDNSITNWADAGAMGVARLIDVIKIIPSLFNAVKGSGSAVLADIEYIGKSASLLNPVRMAQAIGRGEDPLGDIKVFLEQRNKTVAAANAEYAKLWNMEGNSTEQAMARRIAARQKDRASQAADDAARKAAESNKPKLNFDTSGEDKVKAAGINKEQQAYEHLMKSISDKTAVAIAESQQTEKLLPLQAEAAKITASLANGTLVLTNAHKASINAALDAGIAQEKLNATRTANNAALQSYTNATESNLEKLREEVGVQNLNTIALQQITSARQIDKAASAAIFKTKTDEFGVTQKILAASPEMVSQILIKAEADKKEATSLNEKINAQKLSIEYENQISQLKIDNTIYFDAADHALALLEKEAALRRKNIDALKEDTAERRKLIADYAEWYQLSQDKIGADKFRTLWQSVDQTAHDTFVNIFNGGKNAFTKLRDTLKATLLDLLYQMTIKRWVFDITASVSGASGGAISAVAQSALGGGAGGSALSTGLSIGNLASSVSSIATVGSQVLAGSMSIANALGTVAANATGTGITGLLATNGAFGTAAGAAGAGGITAALGAIGPVGWAAIAAGAALAIFGGGKSDGSKHLGVAQRVYGSDGNLESSVKQFEGNAAGVVDGMHAAFVNLKKELGATGGSYFGYGSNFNKDGKTTFSLNSSGFSQSESEMTPESQKLAIERAVFGALKQTSMPKIIAKLFEGKDPGSMSAADITAAENAAVSLTRGIKALSAAMEFMPFEQLKNMAFDTAAALVEASGGLQNLNTNLGTYFDNFYSDAEKRTKKIADITSALNAVGLNVTASDISKMSESKVGRDEFRLMVEAQGPASETNAKILGALYAVSGAFAAITPVAVAVAAAVDGIAPAATAATTAIESTNQALKDTLNTNAKLQDRLDLITGKATTRSLELRDATDDSTKALLKQIYAQEDLTASTKAAADAATSLAATNKTLQDRLDLLTGKSTTRSIELRDATDESTKALLKQIYAQEDLTSATKATADAATAAAAAQAAAAAALQAQQKILMDNVETARSVLKASYDKESSALKDTIQKHTEYAKSLRAFRDSLLLGDNSPLSLAAKTDQAASRFDLTSQKAQAGDIAAIAELQGSSTDYLAALKNSSVSQFDFNLGFARVNSALTLTASNSQSAASMAQAQLTALDASVDGLLKINDSVLSVVDAIKSLSDAVKAALGGGAGAKVSDIGKFTGDLPKEQYSSTKFGDIYASSGGAYGVRDSGGGLTINTIGGQSIKGTDVQGQIIEALKAGNIDGLRAASARTGISFESANALLSGTGYSLPAFDVGTNLVPKDMIAQLHEGEAIVPKAFNPAANGGSNSDVVTELRALRQEVSFLRAEAAATAGHTFEVSKNTSEMKNRGVIALNNPTGEKLVTTL